MNQTINQTLIEQNTLMGFSAPFTSSATMDIYIITLIVALFITLVNKYLTDQVAIKALRAEMKELQKKMRKVMQKDPQKAQKMQQEIMKKNFENMKHTMNPKVMLITFVPIIIVFTFVGKFYGPFGELMDFPFWFFWQPWEWLGVYIFFSLINSILLKKVLDVA